MDNSTRKVLIICATVVICFVIGVSALLIIKMSENGNKEDAVISVFLTMNPVIRIDLNQQGRVLDIVPQDTAAEAVTAGFSTGNLDLSEVVNALTDRAFNLGLVSEESSITLSVYAPEDPQYNQVNTTLQRTSEMIIYRHDVAVEVNRIDEPTAPAPLNTPRP